MPRIWLDYCQFLIDQGYVLRTRRTFDRALRSLPVTQHHRIWQLYIKFVRDNLDLQETAVKVYRRYLMVRNILLLMYINFLNWAVGLVEQCVKLGSRGSIVPVQSHISGVPHIATSGLSLTCHHLQRASRSRLAVCHHHHNTPFPKLTMEWIGASQPSNMFEKYLKNTNVLFCEIVFVKYFIG